MSPTRLTVLVFLICCLSMPAALAGVFGDGNPDNGVEDDRRGISEGHVDPVGDAWFRSGGTVFCDGAVRGSATLLALDDPQRGAGGQVIATAAHVFYDLEQGQPWNACEFRYLGLGELPGYRVSLHADRILKGGFDPAADISALASGAGDWAFAWLGGTWSPPLGDAGLALRDPARSPQAADGVLGLLAWNSSTGEMSVSLSCQAVASEATDLGGGAWAGQWLDDCDSTDGASGGGLVLSRAGRHELVAIRGGQHWDPDAWPPGAYPDGPPFGERWDPQRFTNYARVLDREVLDALDRWLRGLSEQGASGP